MKNLLLTLLVLSMGIYSNTSLSAQVLTQDSLALVDLYNSLGGVQSGLNWDLNSPITQWGDTPVEIELDSFPPPPIDPDDEGGSGGGDGGGEGDGGGGGSDEEGGDGPIVVIDGEGGVVDGGVPLTFTNPIIYPAEGVKYVVGINLKGKGLRGFIPASINQIDSLQRLQIANNEIESLPEFTALPILETLDVSNNQLYALPDLSGRTNLDFMDCSNNFLKFNDIVPVIGIPKSIQYAPHANIPLFVYARDPGESLRMNAYEEHHALPSNVYNWEKDGATVATTELYTINSVDILDGGYYLLSVGNDAAPDLTITAPSYLRVPAEASPTSVINNNPDPEDSTIIVRVCPCIEEELDMYLWDDLDGWLESDTTRMGSGGGPDKDTSELNFVIPFEPRLEEYYCNYSYGSTSTTPTGNFSIRTGIIGTGIADHDSLNMFFAHQSNAVEAACLAPGGRIAYDFSKHRAFPYNVGNPHETHVAGILTRNIPSNIDLKVVDAKIFDEKAYLFDLICAIHFAIEKGVKVLNLSLGYDHIEPSIYLYKALKRAEENNVLVVVSAGNKGNDNDVIDRWPGNFGVPRTYKGEPLAPLTNIIVVAALNINQDGLARISNYGLETVDIAAPGVGILSTVVNENGESDYALFSGTSMAAPIVSRAAAILLAYKPTASPSDIINALMATSTPVSTSEQANFLRQVDLLAAATRLQLPDNILQTLEDDEIYYAGEPVIDEGRPNRSIRHDSYDVLDNYELQLSPDNRNFRNIEFQVYHKVDGGPWQVVYESFCSFGNKIRWDGIWNRVRPGDKSDLSGPPYRVKVRVNNGRVSVQPNKIKPKSQP